MKTVSMPFGRALDYKPTNPDRVAFKSGRSFSGDMTFREWPSRGAMAVTIRMQQSRESRPDDWKPCIPLMDAEGHAGFKAKTLAELNEIFEQGRAVVWAKRVTTK